MSVNQFKQIQTTSFTLRSKIRGLYMRVFIIQEWIIIIFLFFPDDDVSPNQTNFNFGSR